MVITFTLQILLREKAVCHLLLVQLVFSQSNNPNNLMQKKKALLIIELKSLHVQNHLPSIDPLPVVVS